MKTLAETNQLLFKRIILIVYDIIAVVAASLLALFIRFEGRYIEIPREYISRSLQYIPVIIVITLIIFYGFRLYSSLWTYAGAPELINITFASALSAMAQMMVMVFFDVRMPRSYYILYGVSLWILVFLSRFSYRGIRTLIKRQASGENTSRVLLVGAGAAGNMLVKEIRNSNYVSKQVVCIVDDDKSKEGSYLHGVKVLGNRQNIPELVKRYRIDEIIIAMPSAPAKEIKEILDVCKETGCELKRLPGVYQLVNGEVGISKLKEVDVNDLLGREPVKVDLSTILNYVSGKTILVTGGGGSIGSEICRQVAEHHPKMLVLVDIYENTTYDIQNELKNKYPELNLVVLIASVRNTKRMDMIFETYRPDIVYHAAAHKHVPLMEDSPNEAVKNNVLGTWKVVQAADKWKVKRFVMISTDKAVNPTNIMGATKRICEMIIQTYNTRSRTEFVAVRFGNVLGSNGSVIPLFKKQIEQGGPVTVTHPEIIRYFMTIPEAVSLVLQAGAYAKGGEIFVLDMGEPVKIADLARNLILLSGHKPDEDIQIVYTGLRPGEKLYEEMLMHEEGLQETENKLIHIGKPIKMDEEHFLLQLENLKEYVVQEPEDIRKWVQEIVPTYHPQKFKQE
ncbi:nucleoside-diphosphate sugar epimerase/dehydratase [Lachnospiraceae bacterium KK002]